jgi:hypothetical protein
MTFKEPGGHQSTLFSKMFLFKLTTGGLFTSLSALPGNVKERLVVSAASKIRLTVPPLQT